MRERAQCFNNDWKEGEKDIGGLGKGTGETGYGVSAMT